jgi:hypothetical protein
MWIERILLISGWVGVGMILVDLHVYSPFPGKKLTHLGAVIAGICFVLICIRVLFLKIKDKMKRK